MSLSDVQYDGMIGCPDFVIPRELKKEMREGKDPIQVLKDAIEQKKAELTAPENVL